MNIPGIDMQKLMEKELERKGRQQEEIYDKLIDILDQHTENQRSVITQLEKININLDKIHNRIKFLQ